jgi:hypothetical protein
VANQRILSRVLCCCICALAVRSSVAANGSNSAPATAEAQAIERTIRGQIKAFSRDDGAAAFAYATPTIQKMFGGDSDRFLRTVRDSYPAVYRPSSLYFLPPKHQGETWVQVVNVADSGGKLWLAYYDMRKQPDKSWQSLRDANAKAHIKAGRGSHHIAPGHPL